MATSVGEIYLDLGIDFTKFKSQLSSLGSNAEVLQKSFDTATDKIKKQFDSAQVNVKDFEKRIESLGKKADMFNSLGNGLLKFAGVAGIAFGASIKLASDYNESLNKVNVAFGMSANEVEKWSQTSLKSFGMAKGSALDAASTFGDMGTSLGLSQEEAAKMSMQLVQLTGDLASFKNVGIDQSANALKGIFTGETESLKQLGVVMLDSTLKAYALANGYKKDYEEMSQAEKVTLRYKYVLDMTKNAEGDFAKTGGQAAGQMRTFGEALKELGTNFGQVILPAFTNILTKVNEFVTWLGTMDKSTLSTVASTVMIAGALGFVFKAIAAAITVGKTFIAVTTAIKLGLAGQAIATTSCTAATTANAIAMGVAEKATKLFNMALMANPLGVVIGAVAVLTGVIYGLSKMLDDTQRKAERMVEFSQMLNKSTNEYIQTEKAAGRSNASLIKEYEDRYASAKKQMDTGKTEYGYKLQNTDMIKADVENLRGTLDALKKEEAINQRRQATENQKTGGQQWLRDKQQAREKWLKFNEEYGANEAELENMRYDKEVQSLQNAMQRKFLTAQEAATARENLETQHQQNLEKIQKDSDERRKQQEIKNNQEMQQAIQAGFQITSDAFSQISDLFSMNDQSRLDAIDQRLTKQLDALDIEYNAEVAKIEASKLNKQQKDAELQALQEQHAAQEAATQEAADKKKRKLERDAAKRNKEIQTVETIISTATAAMNAYKSMAGIPYIGPALGIAAAAAVSAFGAARIAMIQRQPLPALAEGGYFTGPAIIGEAGPELAVPLSGTQGRAAITELMSGLIGAISNRQVRASTQRQEATISAPGERELIINNNLYLDGTQIYNMISKATDNGQITVNSRAVVSK